MTQPYTIRPARTSDLPWLPDIERAAAALFAPYGLDELFSTLHTPPAVFAEGLAADQLWVAANSLDQPVGFALVDVIGANAHLDELDVHPDHARRGLGTRLVQAVCGWARESGYPAVTLTTLDYIPWNAPFYARLGFRILAPHELSPELHHVLAEEIAHGLPAQGRVAMRLGLAGDQAQS